MISSRTRHWRTALLSVAALALLAACGGTGDAAAGVASLGTAAPDGGADTMSEDGPGDGQDDGQEEGGEGGSAADREEAMLAYAECMREHGIDMPDPQMTGDGGVVIGAGPIGSAPAGADAEREMARFEDAQQECSPILDDAVGSIEIDPEREAEMREQMLAFAECMREHGVDMPDPQFDDNGRVTVRIGSEDGPGDPEEMEAASQACNEELGGEGPFVMGGGPPGVDADRGGEG